MSGLLLAEITTASCSQVRSQCREPTRQSASTFDRWTSSCGVIPTKPLFGTLPTFFRRSGVRPGSAMPDSLEDALPPEQRPGAHRCTNAECEHCGRWLVGTMARTKNGKGFCASAACATALTRMRTCPTGRSETEAGPLAGPAVFCDSDAACATPHPAADWPSGRPRPRFMAHGGNTHARSGTYIPRSLVNGSGTPRRRSRPLLTRHADDEPRRGRCAGCSARRPINGCRFCCEKPHHLATVR